MEASAEITIKIKANCYKCGADLTAGLYQPAVKKANTDEIIIEIPPCKDCLKEAKDDGYCDGCDDGYENGYEKGCENKPSSQED